MRWGCNRDGREPFSIGGQAFWAKALRRNHAQQLIGVSRVAMEGAGVRSQRQGGLVMPEFMTSGHHQGYDKKSKLRAKTEVPLK